MLPILYDDHAMNGQLRRLRERKALSMKQLAELAGINESTVFRVESGRTKAQPGTIRKLAKALDVPPEHLTTEQTRLYLSDV